MRRIDPKLTPDLLRERGEAAIVKARQWAERAELYFRTARRRERAADDRMTAAWPWPCPAEGCGALYATTAELERHQADTGHKPKRGGPRP